MAWVCNSYFNRLNVKLKIFDIFGRHLYKTLLLCYSENPKISITGPTSVLCGNNAKFTADINPENLKGWSITWEKVIKQTSIRINSSTEKYSGSTDKSLVIRHVCKGDTGGYRAILSRDLEEEKISVLSKVIVLQATGGISFTSL